MDTWFSLAITCARRGEEGRGWGFSAVAKRREGRGGVDHGSRRGMRAIAHLHVGPGTQERETTGLCAAHDGLEKEAGRVALVLLDEAPVREDGRELIVKRRLYRGMRL